MSGEMETPKNDVIVDNDDSIPELEKLVACETAHPVSAGVLSTKGRGVGEWMASRPWGQMLFKSVDRVLWCIERTMLWQNPSKDALVPMTRPEPNALVAYPLAAFLWMLQLMFFTADELIKWVQTRRRRLRAVRFLGIRNMKTSNVLGCPVTSSRFTQILWFLGLLSTDRAANKQEDVTDEKEVEERTEDGITTDTDDDTYSEQNKKRRFSAISTTTDEGAIFLDDDNYHSESDSDYVPECSHSSESSDSDLSSVHDCEERTDETELNQSSVHDCEERTDETELNQSSVHDCEHDCEERTDETELNQSSVHDCEERTDETELNQSSVHDCEERTDQTELNQSKSTETTEKIADHPTPSN